MSSYFFLKKKKKYTVIYCILLGALRINLTEDWKLYYPSNSITIIYCNTDKWSARSGDIIPFPITLLQYQALKYWNFSTIQCDDTSLATSQLFPIVGTVFLDCFLCYRWPRWLSWMHRPTGDQEVAGSTTAEVGNILSWRLIMKYFLQSFSPFR